MNDSKKIIICFFITCYCLLLNVALLITSYNVSAYRSFATERSKIWTERPARFPSPLFAVIFPEGLKFGATSRREISESEVGRLIPFILINDKLITIWILNNCVPTTPFLVNWFVNNFYSFTFNIINECLNVVNSNYS